MGEKLAFDIPPSAVEPAVYVVPAETTLYFTLSGRNVWSTNGMTYPPSVGATHKKHWCLKKKRTVKAREM